MPHVLLNELNFLINESRDRAEPQRAVAVTAGWVKRLRCLDCGSTEPKFSGENKSLYKGNDF